MILINIAHASSMKTCFFLISACLWYLLHLSCFCFVLYRDTSDAIRLGTQNGRSEEICLLLELEIEIEIEMGMEID